jgi:uncharacterized membrane protein/Mg-chelatase subunit ChlD
MLAATLLAWFHFETPGYLALLAVIPLLILLSFRSLAGLGPVRRVLAILFRCVVVTAMVMALAGAQRVRTNDNLSVIFLLDRSSSIPAAEQESAFEFIREAAGALRPERDRVGIIAFDGRSAVEQLPRATVGIERISEAVQGDRTNLAGAMRMAMALFTDNTARRVVVLSDGNENIGAALEEAEHFNAAGVPIDVMPLRYEHLNEVVFERLSAPATATADETINLQMVMRSQRQVSGRVLLYHNDTLVDLNGDAPGAGFPVELEPGPNRSEIPVPLRVAGAHRFRAVFEPDADGADTILNNNEGRAFTVVSGQGRILILTAAEGEDAQSARLLGRALQSEKLVCDIAAAGGEPLTQERLLGYSLVILSNVPAHALTEEERKGLAVYVRGLGGGLVMVGGDQSFGAGGWLDTPIEDVMPVSFDVKSKKQIPKGALVLVMHGCEIPQGNYWSERVAIAAVKSLSSRDLIGVMSYNWKGGESGYWDVPLQSVGDKSRVIQGIKKLAHGDMPDLDPLMRSGVQSLIARPDAAAKHMIVLSDFDPQPPAQDVIDDMKKYGITCSTVAIGFGSHPIDVNKARWIANATGGKAYTTEKYSELPRIFIKEAQIVRRSLIQETSFIPSLASTLPSTVAGLAGEPVPALGGYVLTTIKPLAQATLVRKTEDGLDPILAQWQVGLGKSVAFTSGMWTRWGADWADWAKFSKLWGQIARWASRQSAASAFDVSTSVQGGVGRVRIEAVGADASVIDFMNIEGTLVDPAYEASPLRLTQVGPGQYEAEFDARNAGSYVLNLAYQAGSGADAVSGSLQSGVSVAFSPEHLELRTNEPLLHELAERTHGRVLGRSQAGGVFDMSALKAAESRSSVWEDLIRWMLLLFLMDVAVRRIAVHPMELARKVRGFISEMAGRRPELAAAATLSSLKGTREKLREGAPERSETGPAPQRSARYEPTTPDTKVTEQLSEALGGASELNAPVVARPSRKPKATAEPDFTSRLLRAKRQARQDMQDDARD